MLTDDKNNHCYSGIIVSSAYFPLPQNCRSFLPLPR